MYKTPVYFDQVSSREDFIATFKVYDDDTFTLIGLDGTVVAGSVNFTSSAWLVNVGSIATTSSTTITIPVYPKGGELSALSLVVAPGLAITAGQAITIADAATASNTAVGYVTSYNKQNGALVCQIGFTYQFEIRKMPPNWQPGLGYISWYDFGVAEQAPILQASLSNGEIKVTSPGTLQIYIPERTFRTLRSGTYGACMTMTDSIHTTQLFIGRLPVLWGGVSL